MLPLSKALAEATAPPESRKGFERDTVSRFRLSALKKKEGRWWWRRCRHGGGASVAAHKRRRQENRRWSVVVLSQLQRQRRKQQSNWQLAKQAPDELRREVVLPRRDENHRSKLACTQRRQPHHCAPPPPLVDKKGKPSVRPSAAFEVSKRGMVLTIWRLCLPRLFGAKSMQVTRRRVQKGSWGRERRRCMLL